MLHLVRRGRTAALVAVTLLALVVSGCGGLSSAPAYAPSGSPVPLPPPGSFLEISGEEFEGMLVGQRGRVVVVNVWASWCAPCRTEAPLLQRAAESYPDVVFIGVDSRDSRGPAEDFLKEFAIRYTNVYDGSGDIRRRLGLRGFPTTYIFGLKGTLLASVMGGISEQRLAAQIRDARQL